MRLAGEAFRFVCDPACLGAARQWLAASLLHALGDDSALAELISDAMVVSTELVTNAIRASCTAGSLSWQLHPLELELSVFDDGGGWPVLRSPGLSDTHGRGLHIVQALTTRAGTRAVDGGNEAWAVLLLPA